MRYPLRIPFAEFSNEIVSKTIETWIKWLKFSALLSFVQYHEYFWQANSLRPNEKDGNFDVMEKWWIKTNGFCDLECRDGYNVAT